MQAQGGQLENENSPDVLSADFLYLRSQSHREAGKRCRKWSFHDASGTLLLEAIFPEIPGDVIFYKPEDKSTPVIRLKAWRWFWWNGRYDVLDPQSGQALATLRRMGGIEDPNRKKIGCVRNSVSKKRFFLQAIVLGLLDSLLTHGEDNSSLSVDEFKIYLSNREVGTLCRVKLPFLQRDEIRDSGSSSWLKRWFARFRSMVNRHFNSSGWKLDFTADRERVMDPRVRLAAALFRIHIEQRYSG